MAMLAFFDLLLGPSHYKLLSWLVTLILRMRGVKVGVGLYVEDFPLLRIRGKAKNIVIGNNVSIFGRVDLRNRENGKIIIEDDVKIDTCCRLVAAKDATLRLGRLCNIGCHTIFNAGDHIDIGVDVLVAGYCLFQSSSHGTSVNAPISSQEHIRKPISVGAHCWIGSQTQVLMGCNIGENSVVGSNSVVTKDIERNCISAGSPARLIRYR